MIKFPKKKLLLLFSRKREVKERQLGPLGRKMMILTSDVLQMCLVTSSRNISGFRSTVTKFLQKKVTTITFQKKRSRRESAS